MCSGEDRLLESGNIAGTQPNSPTTHGDICTKLSQCLVLFSFVCTKGIKVIPTSWLLWEWWRDNTSEIFSMVWASECFLKELLILQGCYYCLLKQVKIRLLFKLLTVMTVSPPVMKVERLDISLSTPCGSSDIGEIHFTSQWFYRDVKKATGESKASFCFSQWDISHFRPRGLFEPWAVSLLGWHSPYSEQPRVNGAIEPQEHSLLTLSKGCGKTH